MNKVHWIIHKIIYILLRPLFPIIGLGYGKCRCCGTPWNIAEEHTTKINENRGVFSVCKDCWNTKSDIEIIIAYSDLYDIWTQGDSLNHPLSRKDLGFSRAQLMAALDKDLKTRNSENKD